MERQTYDSVSPETVLAIQRILEAQPNTKEDPFDGLAEEFNAVDVLNSFFPDEASLERLQDVQTQLADTQQQLQEEIDSLQAELKRNQDPERMSIIQEMISDLLGQMSRIREKATESEAVVLDLVKRNLIHSTTTIKRLQMLGADRNTGSECIYTGVPRIARLWKLRNQLEEDFDSFFIQDTNNQIKPASRLGVEVRNHIVDRFVALEMKEYRRIFRTNDEAGQLDKPFATIRLVFPSEWKVGWHLLAKFAEITRDHVTTLLTKIGPSLTVKSLLENIQITLEFEANMSRKWATDTTHSQPGKSITSVFEPHMNIFIDAQDKSVSFTPSPALTDMLAPHRNGQALRSAPARTSTDQEEEDNNEPSPLAVLPSPVCDLSTGQPLYDLANLHKKWLRIYANEVLTMGSKRSTETRLDIELLKQTCIIINTADYCQNTATELEEKIKQKINPEYKEKISFQNERDVFISAISSAIAVQLRELEVVCDPPFITLARTSWSTISQVSGPSAYTGDLLMKPLIEQKKYLRNFFDKACSLILVKFTNSVVRSRPLKEIGAEQPRYLLTPVAAYLAKMPGDDTTTNTYTRALNKTTSRLDALLKVIVTPEDPPEGFILNYTLVIGDASMGNFQKILDLKGTPKSVQNNLLDSFLSITSTKTDLESTSFLSSLDMDPPATASHVAGGGDSSSIFAGLTAPPQRKAGDGKQVLSDIRRFMSFGLRKDSTAPP
ncbi:hypothetical protein FA13DRAFT_1767283 [Coprinellus micaceus]|uniref:Vps53 N-terminal domain-containing protein n=1 Tax=Coprinellus micaceus TaxID=71717 RepID=A0A4Y7SBL5_COPMI|nr:hypothetical protein FA13DRAFT_1767283 [Coprinellus micaceus]